MTKWSALAVLLGLAACNGELPRESLPHVAARADWARWPQGVQVGEVSAVDVDSHGHVFVLHRPGRDWKEPFLTAPIAEPVVAMFDAYGRPLGRWGAGETVMPHGLSVAPDDSVWITDAQREQLLHFSHDGVLLDTRGERGVTGADSAHFGRPSDLAATPNALYVADGYLNHRILRLAESMSQWGGDGEGEDGLRVPHSVAVFDGRVIVADRENRRIKISDGSGKVLRMLATPGFPYAAKPLADGRIVSVEGRYLSGKEGAALRLWNATGKQLAALDVAPSGATRAHDLAISRDGTIYIADVAGHRVLTVPLSSLSKD